MKIIAFDIGTNMGVTFSGAMERPQTTSRNFSPRKGAKTGSDEDEPLMARYVRAKSFIKAIVMVCCTHWAGSDDTPVLIYEGASGFTQGISATKLANELRGIIFAEVGARIPNIFIHEVAPSTLKKYVTGAGNAEKADMIIAARRRWGCRSSQHDEVDSFCLWKYADLHGIEGLRVLQAQKEDRKKEARAIRKGKKRAKAAPPEKKSRITDELDDMMGDHNRGY